LVWPYVNAHSDTSTKTTTLTFPETRDTSISRHLGFHRGACQTHATPRWHIAHRDTATPRYTFRCRLAMDYTNLTGRPTPKVRHSHSTANPEPSLPLVCAFTLPLTDTFSPALLRYHGTSRRPTTLCRPLRRFESAT
jgi:hypothetical protein